MTIGEIFQSGCEFHEDIIRGIRIAWIGRPILIAVNRAGGRYC